MLLLGGGQTYSRIPSGRGSSSNTSPTGSVIRNPYGACTEYEVRSMYAHTYIHTYIHTYSVHTPYISWDEDPLFVATAIFLISVNSWPLPELTFIIPTGARCELKKSPKRWGNQLGPGQTAGD